MRKPHPDHIYGEASKTYRCLDCGKILSTYRSSYCVKCNNKGERHPNFNKKRPEHSKKMLGKSNPNYGKRHKNMHSILFKNRMSKRMSGKGNTMYGIKLIGKKNPNYKNGLSRDPYPIEFNNILKERIRKLDKYKCKGCGIKQQELLGYIGKLDIHHIDYNKNNLKINNLISLCRECNTRANYNRDYWFAYYTYKIEDR